MDSLVECLSLIDETSLVLSAADVDAISDLASASLALADLLVLVLADLLASVLALSASA